ncbi:hypothetical protein PGT21_008958 [Puccinia graminis f. sp. tritici]|uniref:Uncharacterized protein n=1 Tax=Puccinia graminis f. sp. tritici TaxID=56615 RepID=A0A5B0LSD2_PUCGR|nr:hypothetical protein PGTUg99_027757 [Puccinia graminis f. sp. tritici]KAA1083849.1 hypothetical protein PGT21_008958 [Puccinia graminis f. sp. tritici]
MLVAPLANDWPSAYSVEGVLTKISRSGTGTAQRQPMQILGVSHPTVGPGGETSSPGGWPATTKRNPLIGESL